MQQDFGQARKCYYFIIFACFAHISKFCFFIQAIRGIQFSNFIKQMLATASDDSSVNLWDVNTQQIVKEFRNEHKMPANGISFSPANDMLMCSIGIDKKIVFYDVVGKK